MSKLILIKHAKPQMDPEKPARDWRLSDEGRAGAARLAETLRDHEIGAIITSDEPKAMETGKVIGGALNVAVETAPGLHEHDRSNVPVMATREFIASVALFFKRPDELVLGRETAAAAKQRFDRALNATVRERADQTVAIVTHGTVLALYVAPLLDEEPFQLWRRLQLPSFVVIDWPSRSVSQVVDRPA